MGAPSTLSRWSLASARLLPLVLAVLGYIAFPGLWGNSAKAQTRSLTELAARFKDKQSTGQQERIDAGEKLMAGRGDFQPAADAVLAVLADQSDLLPVRRQAARILRDKELKSPDAIRTYIEVATREADPSDLRIEALLNLTPAIGEADTIVPKILPILANKNESLSELRYNCVNLLYAWTIQASAAVPTLIDVAKDAGEQAETREVAAGTLAKIKPTSDQIVATLQGLVNGQDGAPLELRVAAVGSLGSIEPFAKALPVLTDVLKKPVGDDENKQLRRQAVMQLLLHSPESKKAIRDLVKVLLNEKEDVAGPPSDRSTRRAAIAALGKMCPESNSSLLDLVKLLDEPDLRSPALTSINAIARSLEITHQVDAIPELTEAAKKARQYGEPQAELESSLESLERSVQTNIWYALLYFISTDWWPQVVLLALGYVLVALLVSYLLLMLAPLWLLRINEALEKVELALQIRLGAEVSLTVRFRYLLLIGCFHYHRRVLDAWVEKHIHGARLQCGRPHPGEEQSVFVPFPVKIMGLQDTGTEILTPAHLADAFSADAVVLPIYGKGGSGKTSLALRLAQWAMSQQESERICKTNPMIPVLIDRNLPVPTPSLLASITRSLTGTIGLAEPPPEGLVNRMLKSKRILVIVDGFSELKEAEMDLVRAGCNELTINALIVTSRSRETFGRSFALSLQPDVISGKTLTDFVDQYLSARGARDLFEDIEYSRHCFSLQSIAGNAGVTVLIAKFYVESMIHSKTHEEGRVPRNVPELMLSYLVSLTSGLKDEATKRLARHAAKVLAWTCIKDGYAPSSVKRDGLCQGLVEDVTARPVGNLLADWEELKAPLRNKFAADVRPELLDHKTAEELLDCLEKRMHVLRADDRDMDGLRFSFDPLAEYLAGLTLVECYPANKKWLAKLLGQADQSDGGPEGVKGFLLVLAACFATTKSDKVRVDPLVVDLRRRSHEICITELESQLETLDPLTDNRRRIGSVKGIASIAAAPDGLAPGTQAAKRVTETAKATLFRVLNAHSDLRKTCLDALASLGVSARDVSNA